MIKKITGTLCALVMLASLAACSTLQSLLSSSQGGAAADGELPEQTLLIIGTLKLEGTEQAVTAEQAAELLPLWKAVKSLGSSDTASEIEIQALYDQIRETMTAGQISAIDGMHLSAANMREVMQGLGIQGMPGGGQGLSEEQIATRTAQRQSQTGSSTTRQGGPPAGDMMFMGGGGPPPEFSAGQQSGNSTSALQITSPLLDPLIELLKERAAQG